MSRVLQGKEAYGAEFERHGRSLPGPSAPRRSAFERFAALGFPTGREEAWRFTDLEPFLERPFRLAFERFNPDLFAGVAKGPLKGLQIAFVDGRHAPAFSSLDARPEVAVQSLAALLRDAPGRLEPYLGRIAPLDGNAFTALHAAFVADGAFVHVGPLAAVDTPIHLLFLSSPQGEPHMTHPRVLVVLEREARATVVESFLGPAGGTYFTNAVTEIALGEGAVLDYYKIQRESVDSFHFAAIHGRAERGASFSHHSISFGGRIARNDLEVLLAGEGADCTLNGLYEVSGRQLVDHHTMVDHAVPNGTSRELYKGILDSNARGVFDGRIVVRPNAQKTNARQANRNLLLSQDARVHTKPRLEILANDVKCKHGATIGQLDENVLFYLRSRGIGLAEARRILVHAFASEILDHVKVGAIRSQMGGCLGLRVGTA